MNVEEPRELTRPERAAVKKLVTEICANYSGNYGCLLLNSHCIMIFKCWTGSYCKYFKKAVLPADPVTEAQLTNGDAVEMQNCAICGEAFAITGKKMYCSDVCTKKAQRKQQREFMRKKRGGC